MGGASAGRFWQVFATSWSREPQVSSQPGGAPGIVGLPSAGRWATTWRHLRAQVSTLLLSRWRSAPLLLQGTPLSYCTSWSYQIPSPSLHVKVHCAS